MVKIAVTLLVIRVSTIMLGESIGCVRCVLTTAVSRFIEAFNRNGETSLSDDYEEDNYFNDGMVQGVSVSLIHWHKGLLKREIMIRMGGHGQALDYVFIDRL